MRAVVLVVSLAELALQAGPDLRSNTNTVSDLDGCHLLADLDSLTNDFVTDADWERAIAPTASDCMDIRAADAAALDLDVDVTVFKFLGFKLRMGSAVIERANT